MRENHPNPMSEQELLWLQNDALRVEFLPAFGGKITSLRSVRTGEEFLLPPLGGYHRVSPFANFSESDGGGFDECLPSVAACERSPGQDPVPDHGDLWRLNWHVDSQRDEVTLYAEAESCPLRLTRSAHLQGASLILDYDLLNLSDSTTSWLWSAHPLLRVQPGDRIVLPKSVDQVSVEYSAGDLFPRNTLISWPTAKSTSGLMTDLSRVGEKDGVTAHKIFAPMETATWGALYRTKLAQGLVFRFNQTALPFLGIWICSDAWPQERQDKQYTVALEPTTSNVDSLADAERNGTARSLAPRDGCQWRIEIQLVEASSLAEFESLCSKVPNPSSPSHAVDLSTQ
jgi:galactose mutarotase-like enzyme